MKNRFWLGVLFVAILLVAQVATAQAIKGGMDCNILVAGRTFSHQFSGFWNIGAIVPNAGAGYFKFQAGGKVTGSVTTMIGNIVLLEDLPQQGTYSLKWDTSTSPAVCKGTLKLDDYVFQMVVTDGGNAIEYMNVDENWLVVTFTGTPVKPMFAAPNCSQASLKGTYSYNARGWIMPPFPLPVLSEAFPFAPFGFSGVLNFDGMGNITGWDTVSLEGVVVPRTFTGTYTMNGNCVATSMISDSMGNPPIHTKNYLTKNGKAMHVINTDFPSTVLAFTATKTGD